MRRTFDEMERLFDWMAAPMMEERLWDRLAVDVADYDDEFVVTVDLPGFDREDIDLTIDDGVLTIAATQSMDGAEETSRFIQRERRNESVSRRISLPEAVIETEADASYSNGVLTVRLPKEEHDEDDDIVHIDIE